MPGPSEVWLGVDVGTQSVRCLAIDHTGRVVARGSAGLRSIRDGVRHEQDPREWERALAEAARQAMAALGPRPVRAIALCATSGTVLLTDQSGEPLTPALMYDDARATSEAARAISAGEPLWGSLGYRPQPSWALPKLVWLLAHTPRLPRRGVHVTHQADHLTGMLIGARSAVDSSHVLKTGYDLDRERWPSDLYEQLGAPTEMLPEVVRPGSLLGEVAPQATAVTGIPTGTPVIAGMTDGCAALIGSGTCDEGAWNSVLGTTLVLKGVTTDRIRDPLGVLYSHRAPDGGWLPGGACSAGAGVLSAEFGGSDLDALSARAAARADIPAFTYPLLSRGERFPFVAPEAKRFSVGELGDEVDRYAAVLRGVAYVERLCFDYLDLLGAPTYGRLSLSGGGARSRYWSQLRADTLGRQVALPRDADPATGMALLARSGAASSARSRAISLADAARELTRDEEVLDPDPRRRDVLTEGYLAMVNALRERGWLPEQLADHAERRSSAGSDERGTR